MLAQYTHPSSISARCNFLINRRLGRVGPRFLSLFSFLKRKEKGEFVTQSRHTQPTQPACSLRCEVRIATCAAVSGSVCAAESRRRDGRFQSSAGYNARHALRDRGVRRRGAFMMPSASGASSPVLMNGFIPSRIQRPIPPCPSPRASGPIESSRFEAVEPWLWRKPLGGGGLWRQGRRSGRR